MEICGVLDELSVTRILYQKKKAEELCHCESKTCVWHFIVMSLEIFTTGNREEFAV